MNKENTKHLLERYPKLYDQHTWPITASCMPWLFECGDGWFKLIDELSRKLEAMNNDKDRYDHPIEAVQVKEKYGTLRFYTNLSTDAVDALIDAAETASKTTCEVCGKPGELRGSGWLMVRCDDCSGK